MKVSIKKLLCVQKKVTTTHPTRHNNYSVQIRRKISENLHNLASDLTKPTRIQ